MVIPSRQSIRHIRFTSLYPLPDPVRGLTGTGRSGSLVQLISRIQPHDKSGSLPCISRIPAPISFRLLQPFQPPETPAKGRKQAPLHPEKIASLQYSHHTCPLPARLLKGNNLLCGDSITTNPKEIPI